MPTNTKWINASIAIGCGIFVLVLAVSAFFLPQWRALHFMQALPYVAVVVLTRRQNPWGYGAGVITASFWDILVLFRSPVGVAAVTGHLLQPDIALQMFGALGHLLIIVASLVGFTRTRPRGPEWGKFFGGGVIAVGYLLAMVWTVGPPEGPEHIKRAFGL